MREKVKGGIEAFGVKALDFSFSTNFSFKQKPLLKKNPFLSQVLCYESTLLFSWSWVSHRVMNVSLERKCFLKRKSVFITQTPLILTYLRNERKRA